MNIGIIGAGNIGAVLARKFRAVGHNVLLSNSRDPESLKELANGAGVTAVWASDAAKGMDVVIVTIPQGRVEDLPTNLFAETSESAVIIDTGNYYPVVRDVRIAQIDDGLTESQWVERQLGRPVVKAFNSISFVSLAGRSLAAGTPGRIALPVAGDYAAAKAVVMALIDTIGFDSLDAGTLAESWRQQPGTPAYCKDRDLGDLKTALAEAERDKVPEYRAASVEFALRYYAGEVTLG